jgi:hypothetical protein
MVTSSNPLKGVESRTNTGKGSSEGEGMGLLAREWLRLESALVLGEPPASSKGGEPLSDTGGGGEIDALVAEVISDMIVPRVEVIEETVARRRRGDLMPGVKESESTLPNTLLETDERCLCVDVLVVFQDFLAVLTLGDNSVMIS